METLTVQLRSGSREDSEALASVVNEWLDTDGARISAPDDSDAIAPLAIAVVVVAVVVGLDLIVRITDWIRERNNCLVVIDATAHPMDIQERCDIASMNGKTVILTTDGQQLRVDRAPGIVDLTSVVSRAIESSASDALAILRASGGEGEVETLGKGIS